MCDISLMTVSGLRSSSLQLDANILVRSTHTRLQGVCISVRNIINQVRDDRGIGFPITDSTEQARLAEARFCSLDLVLQDPLRAARTPLPARSRILLFRNPYKRIRWQSLDRKRGFLIGKAPGQVGGWASQLDPRTISYKSSAQSPSDVGYSVRCILNDSKLAALGK